MAIPPRRLILVVLGERVQVRRRRVGLDAVRLLDVTAATQPGPRTGVLRVARTLLEREREGTDLLLVLRLLADRLDADPEWQPHSLPAPLVLVGLLLPGQVDVQRRRIRIDAVRLTDQTVVTLAVDPRSVVVRRPELQRSREGTCSGALPFLASWPIAWMPPPSQPQSLPLSLPLILVTLCFNRFRLAAVADESTELVIDMPSVTLAARHAPGCSSCSPPSAPPARPRTHPARSSPPGRSPASHPGRRSLIRILLQRVQVRSRRIRIDAVQLTDRTVVTLAIDADGRVRVAARGAAALVVTRVLQGGRQSRRVLL